MVLSSDHGVVTSDRLLLASEGWRHQGCMLARGWFSRHRNDVSGLLTISMIYGYESHSLVLLGFGHHWVPENQAINHLPS